MSSLTTDTEVRLSYTYLLTPRSQNEGDDPTFSTALLIPKTDVDTIKAIKKAIGEALTEATAKVFKGKKPPVSQLRNPLRDGDVDRPDDEVYKGMYFINAKGPRGGKEQPVLLKLVGKDAIETTSEDVIYSGVWARVSIQFYGYDVNGNKGIACGVTAVLSSGKGEPLANIVTAESARNAFGVSEAKSPAAAAFDSPAEEATEAPAEDATEDDDTDPWGA